MPISGKPLDRTKLPTNRHVVEVLMFWQQCGIADSRSHSVRPGLELASYAFKVINEIHALWERANFPIVSKSTVKKKLIKVVDKYYEQERQGSYDDSFWNELFRISRCDCSVEKISACRCKPNDQIPEEARDFLVDQSGPRLWSLTKTGQSQAPKDPPAAVDVEMIPANESVDDEVEPKSDYKMEHICRVLESENISNRNATLFVTALTDDFRNAIAKRELPPEVANKLSKFLEGLDRNTIGEELMKTRAHIRAEQKK